MVFITKNLLVKVAEQPFRGTTLYPAVGLQSAGEEVQLIDAAELWGTETETENNTAEAVCLSVTFCKTFLFDLNSEHFQKLEHFYCLNLSE